MDKYQYEPPLFFLLTPVYWFVWQDNFIVYI